MMFFVVFGFVVLMVVFLVLVVGASRTFLVWSCCGWVVVVGSAWTVCEWLRFWVFTGFFWNLIGTVWMVSDGIL